MSVDRDEIKRRALNAIDNASEAELARGKKDKEYAHSWMQDAIGWISGLMTILGGIFSGCFITTAISHRKGLDDDCEMMQHFRQLREEMKSIIHSADQDYENYYNISPAIIKWANSREDSEIIWEYLDAIVIKTLTLFLKEQKLSAYYYFKDSILAIRQKVAVGIYSD